MKRNGLFALIVLALLALAVSACAPAASSLTPAPKGTAPAAGKETPKPAAKEPVKVAMVIAKTGTFGGPGTAIARAVELEIERVNAKGGADGRPIQLVSYDDQSKSEETVALLKKAAQEDKVAAIIGPLPSVLIAPALPVLRDLKVPAYGFGSPVLTPDDKYFFTNVNTLDDLMTVYFDYIKKKGWKKVAGLHPRDDLSERASKLIETMAAKYGFDLVGQERMGQTDTDVTPQLTKLKALNPEALIAWGTGDPAVLVYKNARQIGFPAPIFFNTSAAGSQWFKLTGDIPQEGLIYVGGAKLQVTDALADTDPLKKEALDFRQAFAAKYGGLLPEYNEAVAWDTVHHLADAVKAGGSDREKIKGYLENSKICGIGFCYTKTPANHVGLDVSSMYVMTAKGNSWILSK